MAGAAPAMAGSLRPPSADISGQDGDHLNESRDAWLLPAIPRIWSPPPGSDLTNTSAAWSRANSVAVPPSPSDRLHEDGARQVPERKMPVPEGIMQVRIDRETGLLTNRADGSSTDEFFKGRH